MFKLYNILKTTSKTFISKHSRNMHCRKIIFNEFGDPTKVTKLVEHTLPDKLCDEQV